MGRSKTHLSSTKKSFSPLTLDVGEQGKAHDKQDKAHKPRRRKAATVAKREIRKQQISTIPLLKSAPMRRIVNKILAETHYGRVQRMTKKAHEAIVEAANSYLVELMTNAQHLVQIGGTDTLEDSHLACVAGQTAFTGKAGFEAGYVEKAYTKKTRKVALAALLKDIHKDEVAEEGIVLATQSA